MENNRNKDFELIREVKEGDASKFRYLVEKYKDVSFSLACSILVNEQDAEDAIQESFIKAFKGLRRFNNKSSFSTWFYTIVVNTCKSKYTSNKRHKENVNMESGLNADIGDASSPYETLSLKERKDLVNKALILLNADESLLLRLFYLAELNIEEIKEVTGFKDSKIKVTLYRARKSFQNRFEKIFGHEILTI